MAWSGLYFSFEDKLRVDFDVDPAAQDVPVPGFLIHPLVENAIKHGMATSPHK